MTQREMVLQYIRDFGSISSMQAFSDLGITRLAACVNTLRKEGKSIEGKTITSRNRYGKLTSFSVYSFKGGSAMTKIYICSPYRGNVEENTKKTKEYCREIAIHGGLPIAPHIYLTQFLRDTVPEEREFGLKAAIELLKDCDEMWVFGDEISEGMKGEIAFAEENEIPIAYINW